MSRKLLSVVAIVLIFATGVFGGRGATALMQWIDSPERVSLGDHGTVLRRADGEVILFSLSTCPYCRQARTWLEAHHVRFKELIVDTDAQAERLFDELKEEGVPVLVTRDRMIRGFDADAYAQAIAGKAKLADRPGSAEVADTRRSPPLGAPTLVGSIGTPSLAERLR